MDDEQSIIAARQRSLVPSCEFPKFKLLSSWSSLKCPSSNCWSPKNLLQGSARCFVLFLHGCPCCLSMSLLVAPDGSRQISKWSESPYILLILHTQLEVSIGFYVSLFSKPPSWAVRRRFGGQVYFEFKALIELDSVIGFDMVRLNYLNMTHRGTVSPNQKASRKIMKDLLMSETVK